MFSFLFVQWCRILIQSKGVDDDKRLFLINVTSDILYLPRAAVFLSDSDFIKNFNTSLHTYATLLRRNVDLAEDLIIEVGMAVSRYHVAKLTFMNTIKEGLIAAAMHPARIEKLIKTYGMEVLDSI